MFCISDVQTFHLVNIKKNSLLTDLNCQAIIKAGSFSVKIATALVPC